MNHFEVVFGPDAVFYRLPTELSCSIQCSMLCTVILHRLLHRNCKRYITPLLQNTHAVYSIILSSEPIKFVSCGNRCDLYPACVQFKCQISGPGKSKHSSASGISRIASVSLLYSLCFVCVLIEETSCVIPRCDSWWRSLRILTL